MIASVWPKALLRKEWYQQRWYALITFLLIVPSVLMLPWNTKWIVLHPILATHMHTYSLTSHEQFVRNFQLFMGGYAQQGSTGLWATWVVIGLAVSALYVERRNQTLWFTLTTPVTKRQILRMKWTFGIGIIVAVFGLIGTYLLILDNLGHVGIPNSTIASWCVNQIGAQMAMYSLAFCASVLIGNPIVSAISVYTVALLPSLFSWVFGGWYQRLTEHLPNSWIYQEYIGLSPLALVGGHPVVWYAWLFMLWSFLVAYIGYVASQWAFDRVQAEHLSELFTFPRMRMWGCAFICILSGISIVRELFPMVPIQFKLVIMLTMIGILWRWLFVKLSKKKIPN